MSYIPYAQKLLDPRWQKRRLEVLQRDEFTCQWCSETEKTLHVHHHCYPESRNPWDSDLDAMITLCCDCHKFDHLSDVPDIIKDVRFMLSANFKGNGWITKHLVKECLAKYK